MAARQTIDPIMSDRNIAQWLLLAALGLWAVLAVPFFQGCLYGFDDLTAYHLPTRYFYAQCLSAGEPFDWCPSLFGGFYLTGEGQLGAYHPWHLAAYRWLPFQAAFASEVLLPFPVMFAGMVVLLRRHALSRSPSMFGALVFTFSSFHCLHFMHVHALAILAHLPWALYAIDVAARSTTMRRRAPAEMAVGLLTASQVLLGYPQYTWFVGLAEVWYLAYLRMSDRAAHPHGEQQSSRWLDAWGWYVVAKSLGLAMGMIQLAPTADLLATSTRSAADANLPFTGSWHPWNLLQWVGPYLFAKRVVGQNTPELAAYLGAVPLVLVVWLVCRRGRDEPWAAWQRATGLLVIVALLLACGEYAGLYWLQTWLPVVGRFRFPCRYLCLVSFGVAALAAMALDSWLRAAREGDKSLALQRLWYPAVVSGVIAALSTWLFPTEHLAGAAWRAAGPVLLVLAAANLRFVAQGYRWAVPLWALFTAVDLGAYGLSHGMYREIRPLAEVLTGGQVPPGTPGQRVAAQIRETHGVYNPDCSRLSLLGWSRWDGYAGLEPQRRLNYRTCQALRAAGVAWVGRDRVSEKITGLTVADDRWLQVPQPMPRARLVPTVVVCRDLGRDLERIDLATTALVDAPCPGLNIADESQKEIRNASAGTLILLADRPGRIALRVETKSAQLLVITESFHPGWRAAVNGRRAPVVRVNGDFLGVVVPSGARGITLAFRPDSLIWGRRVTWCALGAWCAWGVIRAGSPIRYAVALRDSSGVSHSPSEQSRATTAAMVDAEAVNAPWLPEFDATAPVDLPVVH